MTRSFAAMLSCVFLLGWATASAETQVIEPLGSIHFKPVCPGPIASGYARCHSWVVVDRGGAAIISESSKVSPPRGYGPADLRAAYGIVNNGRPGTIVAIIAAYGYPNAERDLGVYRSTFGLPPCATANGCFARYGQSGGPPDDTSGLGANGLFWQMESALDIEMVSAMCGKCRVILVEANTDSYADLGAAVNTAANLGAKVISTSYGGSEVGTRPSAADYDHPFVAITASSGDSGYGVEFPASSPYVTAVGGTTLRRAPDTPRGWSETTWSGSGSGCSALYPKPRWQRDPLCPRRMVADVAAVADPRTGVAVYAPISHEKSVWQVFGGTSIGPPLIAGIYADNGGPVLYGSNPYFAPPGSLNDIISGSNGNCPNYMCRAGPGYDGPTGLGTPNGKTAF